MPILVAVEHRMTETHSIWKQHSSVTGPISATPKATPFTVSTPMRWQQTAFYFDGTLTHLVLRDESYVNDGAHNAQVSFTMYGGAVPEPTTMTVLGAGLVAFLRRRKR
ncbi:MAG: PEP-CTERM sorting domain-containing protein [Armatimonadetes bacterium]|nr:PEP-CTERM sorting domain-containing protein [Armatimonadota bacterium]